MVSGSFENSGASMWYMVPGIWEFRKLRGPSMVCIYIYMCIYIYIVYDIEYVLNSTWYIVVSNIRGFNLDPNRGALIIRTPRVWTPILGNSQVGPNRPHKHKDPTVQMPNNRNILGTMICRFFFSCGLLGP